MVLFDRKKRLKFKYGITIEQYDSMLLSQKNKCYICNEEKKLVVDHCHKTGAIRKLLCHGCNTVLGKIEKGEYEQYSEYIKEHNNFNI